LQVEVSNNVLDQSEKPEHDENVLPHGEHYCSKYYYGSHL